MSQVAFVADRLGQQPVAGPSLRRLELGRETLAAQRLDPVDGPCDGGPHLGQERAVPGEAEVLHDGVDELALAVVFREPVGAVPVDAAGDGAVGSLMAGVPADVVPYLPGAAHAHQGRRHGRAVPDPRSRVAARTRLEGGSVAIDQDVRRSRPERVREGSSPRRETNVDAAELGALLADCEVELLRTVDTSARGGEGRV